MSSSMVSKKKNLTFSYLSAMAILMVVDDHMSSRIGFLTSVFPYNSFYMPLFVFISGYFYKQKDIKSNICHKFQHLIIPYLIWDFLWNIVEYLLFRFNILQWYRQISLKRIINVFVLNPSAQLSGAMWFVVMLFWVSIIYNIIRRIIVFDNKLVNIWLQFVFCICGFIVLNLCMKGYTKYILFIFIARVVFYIQFYHMGYFFKEDIEVKINKMNGLIVCTGCFLLNCFLVILYGNKINFVSTSSMKFFKSWWLPLITSISGILFYYKIMHFLSEKIGESKIISFISDNTFTVMASHLFFANIPNIYIYILKVCIVVNMQILI